MVRRLVFAARWACWLDDQHHPLLQLQGYSVDAKAAVASDCASVFARWRDLAVLGVRASDYGRHLCRGWAGVAPDALYPAPAGFADRVIHAFHGKGIPSTGDCGRVFAARRGTEVVAGRKPFCRLGFSL